MALEWSFAAMAEWRVSYGIGVVLCCLLWALLGVGVTGLFLLDLG